MFPFCYVLRKIDYCLFTELLLNISFLIVPNYVSYIDTCLILYTCDINSLVS